MTTKIKNTETNYDSIPASVPSFGYELIREELLPSILGKETASILYWAGKDLARKHPLQNIDEIINFFSQAGWGTLIIRSESKHELQMELTSTIIADRLKNRAESTFQIEAGFLAQQIESQREVVAEAYEHPKKRAGKVHFTIKWDSKDSIG